MDRVMECLFKGAAAAALVLFVASTLLVPGLAYAKAHRYDISPPPHWVQPTTVDTNGGRLRRDVQGGSDYLLVDRQFRVQNGWSEYQRYVIQVANSAGVEDNSDLTIEFDPALEHLTLHAVTVRRGGLVIDELRDGRIQVLQRESELEQGLMDGSLTFHLLMNDVRVGDIIDESYTVERREPAFGNRFFDRLATHWDDPIARSRLRVLIPATAPLAIGGSDHSAPVKRTTGGWQTLDWNWSALPGVVSDEDAPSWYEQYPAIEFSQFVNWGEVVRTALPLYSFDAKDPQLVAEAEQLKSNARTQSDQALAALRFVQEKIRYTGLELGSGAFRPRPPGAVLRSRYGDCKDKALLAVALLRALGMDAAPALVSTRWMGHLDDHLPSPGDFDHAIVRLRLAGKTYWVDVTETAEGGVLDTLDQSDLGQALVISPGVSAPESIPPDVPAQPLVTATEVFDLRAGMNAEGSYTMTTVYHGSEADGMRLRLRRTSAAELGRKYLNYYKGRYPGIRAMRSPEIQDDLVADQITVNEAYRIAHPFEVLSSGRRRFEIDAELIADYAHSTDHPVRKAPLALDYPVNVADQVTIRLPRPFPVKDDEEKIDDAVFSYDSHVTHTGNDVFFNVHYRTLADEVTPAQLDGFLSKLDEVRQDSWYQFTSNDDVPFAGTATVRLRKARPLHFVISGPSIVTITLSLAFGLWCGWLVLRYDPTPEQPEGNAPSGIRGFLLLPTIWVALDPLLQLLLVPVWLMEPWISAISHQPWHYCAYLAFLALFCVQLVGSVVCFRLFFRKRSSAPAVVVVCMWLSWLAGLGLALFYMVLGISHYTLTTAVGTYCRELFIFGALTMYFLGSRRVKATFVNRRHVRAPTGPDLTSAVDSQLT